MATKQKRRRKSKAQRQHARDKESADKAVFQRQDPRDYTLTFGKFRGQKIGDIPYNYLQWLKGVETHDLSVKAAQRVARGLGHRKKVGTRQQVQRIAKASKGQVKTADRVRKPAAKPTPPAEPKRPGAGYKLRFGKHCGERLDTLEEGYLAYVQRLKPYNATIAADQQAVEKYLLPAVSRRGKRRYCAVCDAEQRGVVCVRCGWDLVSVERTGPVATMLQPDDW